jgi:peroxiredoxin
VPAMVRIGDKAPDFTLKGVSRGQVSDYSIQDYKGKWLVLFFYPADFTFICPTEVSGFSKLSIGHGGFVRDWGFCANLAVSADCRTNRFVSIDCAIRFRALRSGLC